MGKKHDESKDLRSFSRIGSINPVNKTLSARKGAIIGIHMWGKIDYLTHYCGYTFVWDNDVVVPNENVTDNVKKHYKKEKEYKRKNLKD